MQAATQKVKAISSSVSRLPPLQENPGLSAKKSCEEPLMTQARAMYMRYVLSLFKNQFVILGLDPRI